MQTSPVKSRILLVALSGIGNFIMQSPVFAALKSSQPGCQLTVWVAPRGTRTLAENNPAIAAVIEAPIKQPWNKQLAHLLRLRRANFDVGIVLSPGQQIKSAAFLWAAGIPKRIGSAYPLGARPNSAWLLTDGVVEITGLHDIEQNLRLLRPLLVTAAAGEPYSINIPASAHDKAEKILADLNLVDKKLLGIHAGSAPDFLWKRWPLARFANVAKHFIAKGYAILIFGGPDELAQKKDLSRQIGQHSYLIDSGLLTATALLKKCSVVLANDSGLMHLAAAAGANTFGIFGPTDERLTGPRGRRSHVIRAAGTTPVYHTEKNYNLGRSPHESLMALTSDQVIIELERKV